MGLKPLTTPCPTPCPAPSAKPRGPAHSGCCRGQWCVCVPLERFRARGAGRMRVKERRSRGALYSCPAKGPLPPEPQKRARRKVSMHSAACWAALTWQGAGSQTKKVFPSSSTPPSASSALVTQKGRAAKEQGLAFPGPGPT